MGMFGSSNRFGRTGSIDPIALLALLRFDISHRYIDFLRQRPRRPAWVEELSKHSRFCARSAAWEAGFFRAPLSDSLGSSTTPTTTSSIGCPAHGRWRLPQDP